MTDAAATTTTSTLSLHPQAIQEVGAAMHRTLETVVAIEPQVVQSILVALFGGGHVLIEGVPGVGKTLLARTLSRCIAGGTFRRVQFTNDLMPSDILGASVWRSAAEEFEFVPGPVFTNVLLADEINRTSPRTLSCLLEVMEESAVSVEGQRRPLPDPFVVLATRNPVEFHGTYPVPEAALDRFLVRVTLGYPDAASEQALYLGRDPGAALAEAEPVLDLPTLREVRALVPTVRVSEPIAAYCQTVVQATRDAEGVVLGASPRAALAWLRAVRTHALLDGRDYVIPDDLKHTARPVLAHRIFLQSGGDATAVLDDVLHRIPVRL